MKNVSTTAQNETPSVISPATAPHVETAIPGVQKLAEQTIFPVLFAISFSHLLNDTIQSLVPAIYPW